MENKDNIINLRAHRDYQRKLRIIAALSGETMTDAIERLIDQEYLRIQSERNAYSETTERE